MPKLQRLIHASVAAILIQAPLPASAGALDRAIAGAGDFLGLSSARPAQPDVTPIAEAAPAAQTTPAEEPMVSPREPSFSARDAELAEIDMPTVPSVAVAELPAPSVETPLKKLFCAEYARARSGLALFGDAKFWWSRAKHLYARITAPAENAVMVFTASKRIHLGHVAVVTDIVSAREVRVDQANWENHGEIDHSTPVLDVSKKNDWSQVRVWDLRSQAFGAHVYAISGFIAKELTRQASNQ